jgi:hypothetical protein
MSKKTNTLWFILGATAFNILVTIVSFVVMLVLYSKYLLPALPEDSAAWGLPVIFIGSMVLSFVTYRVVLKQILKRVNMEKHFAPLFGGRRPPVRRNDG